MVADFSTIRSINLCGNPIKYSGFYSIIFAARKNATLQELKIESCDIEIANGMQEKQILDLLEENWALCTLLLNRNIHISREFII